MEPRTRESIRLDVVKLLEDRYELDPNCLTDTARLVEDLSLDSFDLADLVIEIEEKFEIDISTEFPEPDVETIGDLVNGIKYALDN
jgi:acyl carrier protein